MRYDGHRVILDRSPNYIRIEGIDYKLAQLPSGKAAASSVFKAIPSSDDTQDDIVIKFCTSKGKIRARFKREISSIQKANSAKCKFVVNLLTSGTMKVSGKDLEYYTMEYADEDLCSFLDSNEIGIGQKLFICSQISNSIKELHSLGIYHRDIKPDNFLMIGSNWKICDLGLISHRHEDGLLDGPREGIGPKGFMSPEATNYKYALENNDLCSVDKVIDNKSDIFQLGKLFWYILQGDVPTGHVTRADFVDDAAAEAKLTDEIFAECLLPMLQYSKSRRLDIDALIENMTPVFKEYAIV